VDEATSGCLELGADAAAASGRRSARLRFARPAGGDVELEGSYEPAGGAEGFECVLISDGDGFRLERLSAKVLELKSVAKERKNNPPAPAKQKAAAQRKPSAKPAAKKPRKDAGEKKGESRSGREGREGRSKDERRLDASAS
jgi:hypothetical protein